MKNLSSDLWKLVMCLAEMVIGILLFIATILRLKVNFLRKAFVPVSLIAGIIGLILGPYVLKVFPSELRSSMAALPSTMIVIVFSVMMIGVKQPKVKETAKLVAPMFFQGYTYSFVQFGLTCLLTGLTLCPLLRHQPPVWLCDRNRLPGRARHRRRNEGDF